MAGGKPDALDAGHIVHNIKQVRKGVLVPVRTAVEPGKSRP